MGEFRPKSRWKPIARSRRRDVGQSRIALKSVALMRVTALLVTLATLLVMGERPVHADDAQPLRAHFTLGAAHAVGAPQYREFAWGGAGSVALELPLGSPSLAARLGAEAKIGALFLDEGEPPTDPTLARQTQGLATVGTLGVRLRPFMVVAGPWASVGIGGAQTGDKTRLAFDAAIGWDFRLSRKHRWDVGPYAGYTQIVQPDDSLRPNDARVLTFGLQFGLGVGDPRPRDRDGDAVLDDVDACPDVFGFRTNDPKTNGCPRGDRDTDGVFDDEDACPDTPGRRTDDPKTNGCPRGDRDGDGVFDDEDVCPDLPGPRTNDPKTNGCPRGDRDRDSVFDDEDACPDVPGVRTIDATTNGCPPSAVGIRVERDRILLDDVILFDLDSPRIRHASRDVVKKLAEFITATPEILEVSIEGHADATGKEQHNVVLSRERAESVRKMLIQFGVAPERLKAEAFGRSRLKVQTRRAEAANRRVEFWITKARQGTTP